MRLFSPAKLNLFFKLGDKREDGYHNLSSLFQAISLGDILEINLSDKDSFTSNDSELSFNDENFIVKALFCFREKTKLNHPVSIVLDKKIPKQTGLGGGSSNASTTLWALNELLGRPLTLLELQELSAEVTSDSPFFFSEGTALCEGRGEIVKNMPALCKSGFLVRPSFGMCTTKAYQVATSFPKQSISSDALLKCAYSSSPTYPNDLERAAIQLHPKLAELKTHLKAQTHEPVFMTGSGSGLVFFGDLAPQAQKTVQIYPFRYITRPKNSWYQA